MPGPKKIEFTIDRTNESVPSIEFNISGSTPEIEPVENKIPDASGEFEHISRDFQSTMSAYLNLLPTISVFGYAFRNKYIYGDVIDYMERCSESSSIDGNKVTYVLDMSEHKGVMEILRNMHSISKISVHVPRMLFIGAVSSLEYSMNAIMRVLVGENIDTFANMDTKISLGTIINLKDFEAFKKNIVEDELYTVFMKSIDGQISDFEKLVKLSKSIPSTYDQYGKIVEIFERRNLFVHTGGVVGEKYISRGAKYGFNSSRVKVGDELTADAVYFAESLRILTEFGAVLIQLAWRNSRKKETDAADKDIGDFGYNLIGLGEYKLASRVIKRAVDMRPKAKAWRHMANVINLANSHKLGREGDVCDSILEREDWSAAGLEFRICVAAVKSDVRACVRLMREDNGNSISAENYEEWPAFFHVRDKPSFVSAFESVFGRKFVPIARNSRDIVRKVMREKVT